MNAELKEVRSLNYREILRMLVETKVTFDTILRKFDVKFDIAILENLLHLADTPEKVQVVVDNAPPGSKVAKKALYKLFTFYDI